MDGRRLVLTPREFDLLAHLLAHPGEAFSREELLSAVWGWEYGDLTTVTVHVRRLREKVEAEITACMGKEHTDDEVIELMLRACFDGLCTRA